jgi:hypothetical protein
MVSHTKALSSRSYTSAMLYMPHHHTTGFYKWIDEMSLRASQTTAKQLSNELFISFEEVSLSRFNTHYSPVTTGAHGTSIFAGAFDTEGVVGLL